MCLQGVERRLLRGETIPHEEKVFSICEEHTRWVSKGKAGTPVELGVPVAIIEDQYGFILHHKVLWEGEDVDVAVSMVQGAQALYPELRACSFDRGFHSRDNRVRLDALLDVNALSGRGYLSRADREREKATWHSASVPSLTNRASSYATSFAETYWPRSAFRADCCSRSRAALSPPGSFGRSGCAAESCRCSTRSRRSFRASSAGRCHWTLPLLEDDHHEAKSRRRQRRAMEIGALIGRGLSCEDAVSLHDGGL